MWKQGFSCLWSDRRTSHACRWFASKSVFLCALRPKDPGHQETRIVGMPRQQPDQPLAHPEIRPSCEIGSADSAEVRMWESHGFSECANSNVLVASDGTGGSRDTPKCLRKVAFGVATYSLHVLSRTTFEVQTHRFLGLSGARQTLFLGRNAGEPFKHSVRVDVKTTIQLPIDAKYVTKGVTQNTGRSGKTEVINIPSAIQQDKIAFHHMLANSLADVVAEEAAKRQLPDMTFDLSVVWVCWKLLWYRPCLLLRKPVGEIANTSHLLVRHRSDLRCQACNIYRACRQFKFWANTLRSSAKS